MVGRDLASLPAFSPSVAPPLEAGLLMSSEQQTSKREGDEVTKRLGPPRALSLSRSNAGQVPAAGGPAEGSSPNSWPGVARVGLEAGAPAFG